MDRLIEILTELRPDIDFRTQTQLMTGGALDSLDLMLIVGEIVETFNVSIQVSDIKPENFESAEAIYALIKSKQ